MEASKPVDVQDKIATGVKKWINRPVTKQSQRPKPILVLPGGVWRVKSGLELSKERAHGQTSKQAKEARRPEDVQ